MEWYILLVVVSFVLGLVLGAGLVLYLKTVKTSGVLRIENADPLDPPYLFVELKEDVDDLANRKEVSFIVNSFNYSSRG